MTEPCTCGGALTKIGPHSYQCRACRQLWRDDRLPAEGFLTMVTPETDLPPWFTTGICPFCGRSLKDGGWHFRRRGKMSEDGPSVYESCGVVIR